MTAPSSAFHHPARELNASTQEAIQALARAFGNHDWSVQEGFLAPPRISALRHEAEALRAQGAFHAAGIGPGAERHTDIRGDEILWFEGDMAPQASSLVCRELEALRFAVNAASYLGLGEFEGHYAAYPPGTAYARHLDGFRDNNRRALSLVLYLNEAWSAEDGGALRLCPEGESSVMVLPRGGTLVCFLSERVQHEVLPARRMRLSLTGWFRRRA